MELSEVILGSILTEKSSLLKAGGVYVLKVSPRSNKILIKQAVEKIFSTKVISVKIVNRKVRIKRSTFGKVRVSKRSSMKKAYVKVGDQKISALEV